jgi:hypothetical protein
MANVSNSNKGVGRTCRVDYVGSCLLKKGASSKKVTSAGQNLEKIIESRLKAHTSSGGDGGGQDGPWANPKEKEITNMPMIA